MSKKRVRNREFKVILKKGYPIGALIEDVASTIKTACPDLFKLEDPFPTVRMVKFKKGEILYEICEGSSRAKTGPV